MLVLHIREMYGDETPMMFRTRHIRARSDQWAMLVIEQLDQGMRAVGAEMGVREFRWGDLMIGYSSSVLFALLWDLRTLGSM
jgi:hypothetical protein